MNNTILHYAITPYLTISNQHYPMHELLRLLNEIGETGNLSIAADRCNYSYRKAWDMLRQFEKLFNLPLVEKQRGKGSKLSEQGKKLLDIINTNNKLLNEKISIATANATDALNELVSNSAQLKIFASDSEKIQQLRQQNLPIEIYIDGSIQALKAYKDKKCEIAGFHISSEKNHQNQLDYYSDFFDENDQFLFVEERQQGLISHPEHPVHSLQQMVDQQLNFVNRQAGSGTRLLLDTLLQEQNISQAHLKGYFHEEHTHLAVASMVSSRQADAGLGIQTAAVKLNLHFTAISSEMYFVVFKSLNPKLQLVLDTLADQKPLEIISYTAFNSLISHPSSHSND